MVEYSYTMPVKNGRIQLAPSEWCPGLGWVGPEPGFHAGSWHGIEELIALRSTRHSVDGGSPGSGEGQRNLQVLQTV